MRAGRLRPLGVTLMLCAALLPGCAATKAGDAPPEDMDQRLKVRGQTGRPLPERVPASRAPATGEAPADLVASMRDDVIRRSGANPGTVRLVRDESTTWSDGSLGCPRPGEFYTQSPVPGYWIVFEVAGRVYDYRSDDRGNFRLCEATRPVLPSNAS